LGVKVSIPLFSPFIQAIQCPLDLQAGEAGYNSSTVICAFV
jgi:hypothetical protein